jgi:intein/homing endonuclease
MNKDLLYATGLILGDGSLSAVPNKNCSTLHKTTYFGKIDEDVVIEFKRIVEEYFNSDCVIKHDPDNHIFKYSTSKGIVFDFFALNTAHKTKFPDYLNDASKDECLSFLAGLLDSDGFASFTRTPERKDNKGRLQKERDQFRMGFTNTRFIIEMIDLLDKLGIKYGKIWTNNHQTEHIKGKKIGKQLSRYTIPIKPMSFVEQGGYFRCVRKQSRLIKYLEYMKSCYFAPQRLNAERLLAMV